MPSAPTIRNRFELQETGEGLNVWGSKLNQTAISLMDEALDGVEPIVIASTAVVLTSVNYGTDQARNRALVLTGTLTGNTTVTVPSVEKVYLVVDNTTRAGFTLTMKTSGGSGYALRPGPQWAFSDSVDVYRGQPRMDQLPLPAAAVDMNGQRLTNLPTPSANSDAATKKYVDDTAFSASSGQLPGQSGNNGKVLGTDGTIAGWYDPAGLLAGANLTGSLNETAVTVASAATTDLGGAAGNAVRITGTTTITALGTAQSGARRHVTFSGALTLTHNGTSLILPGAANIVTAAGDTAEFESLGGGSWRCMEYNRASGIALPAVGNVLAAPVVGKYVALNWNSTITIDLTAGNVFAVTLGGATTFANPTITSAMIGMEVHIIAKQDATGSRTIGLGSYWKFPLGATPIWSTAAGKTDHLVGIVVSTTEIHVTGILGY